MRNLRDAAEMHRRIYRAIRSRDAAAARAAMHEHLVQASTHQSREADAQVPSGAAARRLRGPGPRAASPRPVRSRSTR